MPASSNARDPSPPPSPAHPSVHNHDDDEEEEDAAVDESTPFISSSSDDSAPSSAPPSFPRTVRILTALALAFSILTLASLFATAIAKAAGPGSFNLPWPTKDGLNGIVAPAIISLLLSAYNLRRLRAGASATAPLALNLVVDVAIAFFAILYGVVGAAGLQDGQGGGWCSYPGGDYALCRRGRLPLQVFAGVALGTAVVFGLMHLLLFCVRCRIAYGVGLGPSKWSIPAGQLKLEISIKFLREPEREEREGNA